jgi:hypothetical protein
MDRRYPLREVPEALRYLEEGHFRGKVFITVRHYGSCPILGPDPGPRRITAGSRIPGTGRL